VNWTVWGPVLGTLVTAILGLSGLVFKARKDHHAALEQSKADIAHADAAKLEAQAALESARATAKTAEATAAAAINDTFTRAYDAASQNWARFCDANDKTIRDLRDQIAENTARVDQAEIRAEADRQARDEAEKKFRIAVAWMRRAIRWINENLPGAAYPPLPPEIDLDLYDL
jgi:chromosome segregation ATPase